MKTYRQAAFTLVEMLVVAPMIILLIGAMITVVATLTGESLQATKKNELISQTQNALSTIEANAQYSMGTIGSGVSTGTLAYPQGLINGVNSSTLTSNSSVLVMKLPATTQSTFSYGRSMIYANPSCGTSTTPYPVYYIYFVENNTLYERTVLGSNDVGAACSTPYQRSSCKPGMTGTPCQKEDDVLATNVDKFIVTYGTNMAKVTLELKDSIAGKDVNYSSVAYATHDTSYAGLPTAPLINQTYNSTGSNAFSYTYSWGATAGATSYDVDYRIDGGAWINGQNNTSRSYSVQAPRKATIEVRVKAITPNGNVDYATTDSMMPRWNECTPGSGWTNYDTTYNTLGFTKTSSGAVGLKGLVKGGYFGSVYTICVLPVGLRPSHHLIFNAVSNGGSGRIDIYTDGRIAISNGNNGWVSFDGIIFMAGNPGWTSGSWISPWYYNGSGYGDLTYPNLYYMRDSQSRVWIQGLATGGAQQATMATLPSNMAPSAGTHFNVNASNWGAAIHVLTNNTINSRYTSSGHVAAQLLYYAAGAGMTPLSLTNWWGNYNNGWTTAACKRGTDDIVIVQGLVANGTAGSIANVGNTCGMMSTGRRALFPAWRGTETQGRIDMPTDGTLLPIDYSTAWTSLDSIHYIAD